MVLLLLLLPFRGLVLLGVVPREVVWAGRITSRRRLVALEAVSISVLILAVVVVAVDAGYVSTPLGPRWSRAGVWLFVAFFLLNTVGNLTAKRPIERYGFGALTFVLALLFLWQALS